MNDLGDLKDIGAPPLPEGTPEHIALLCEAYDFAQFSELETLNRLPNSVFLALRKLLEEVQVAAYGPPKTCKTCKHHKAEQYNRPWAPGYKYCQSDKIIEDGYPLIPVKPSDMLVYDYSESGGFQTGPDFGCVHWLQNDSN